MRVAPQLVRAWAGASVLPDEGEQGPTGEQEDKGGQHGATDPEYGFEPRPRARPLFRQGPQPHRTSVTAGQRPSAVGGDGHTIDPVRMSREAAKLLARLHVPKAQRPVETAGEDAPAVRRKDGGADLVGVSLEAAQLLARLGAPQAERPVPAPRHHAPALRGEG